MIYFIQAGNHAGPVKIGHCTDLSHRLRSLQCGHHENLSVIRTTDGARSVEKWLHRHFSHISLRGEWFSFSGEMLTINPPALVDMDCDDSPLNRAISIAGSQQKLADLLGTTQALIWFWLKSSKRGVPAERCIPIEKATGISRHELRPDIFGPAPEQAA